MARVKRLWRWLLAPLLQPPPGAAQHPELHSARLAGHSSYGGPVC